MSATIRYNGSVIATVAAGESKILECAEKKMASNVSVELPEGYVIPEGTVSITENGTHDVSGYASAEVNVESSGGGGIVLCTVKPSVTLATNIPVGSITANMTVAVNDISDLTVTEGE